jgi:aspartyl/glutamyl-tRNA(Asn/Gln) amidotransferase C subunit
MNEEINKETFAHLVDLAALQLTPEEAEYLRQQLNNQLNAIHELEAIPLDTDATITAHGITYSEEISTAPRADIWQPYPNVQAILDQAPQFEDGYIIVPEIPHTDLE